MDDLDVLVAELHHMSAERDAAIARAEAAEALAASRLDVSPEDAALFATMSVGKLREVLRAHAAKVSR